MQHGSHYFGKRSNDTHDDATLERETAASSCLGVVSPRQIPVTIIKYPTQRND